MICETFTDSRYNHSHEGSEQAYQLMYFNTEGETCAGRYTEDEIAELLVETEVANSFRFIGTDADVWSDDTFRERVCDKALELIRSKK